MIAGESEITKKDDTPTFNRKNLNSKFHHSIVYTTGKKDLWQHCWIYQWYIISKQLYVFGPMILVFSYAFCINTLNLKSSLAKDSVCYLYPKLINCLALYNIRYMVETSIFS